MDKYLLESLNEQQVQLVQPSEVLLVSNSGIARQGDTFLGLIEAMALEQENPDPGGFIPAFSALRACLVAGWRPKQLSKVRHYFIITILKTFSTFVSHFRR